MRTKILSCKRINGEWLCKFMAISGGTCLVSGKTLGSIFWQIREVNNMLKEVI